jgi:hypothetical protein
MAPGLSVPEHGARTFDFGVLLRLVRFRQPIIVALPKTSQAANCCALKLPVTCCSRTKIQSNRHAVEAISASVEVLRWLRIRRNTTAHGKIGHGAQHA